MNLFGESIEDRRDFRIGLAGLLGGIHSLRILAERGIASPDDIITSLAGVRKLLDDVPTWRPGEREDLEDMFTKMTSAAINNYGKHNG